MLPAVYSKVPVLIVTAELYQPEDFVALVSDYRVPQATFRPTLSGGAANNSFYWPERSAPKTFETIELAAAAGFCLMARSSSPIMR